MSDVETQRPTGVPFDRETMAVSEWSRQVYDALANWPVGSEAKWDWWQPGYLCLTISHDAHGPIEPVLIDTCDDELTVSFGMWETDLPSPYVSAEDDLAMAVEEAKQLTNDWIASRCLTVVYFDSNGKWCGSLSSLPDELEDRLAYGVDWIKYFSPARAEVRTAKREHWRFFTVSPNGKLNEQIAG